MPISNYSGATFIEPPTDKLGARFRDIISSLRGFGSIFPDFLKQLTGEIGPTEQAKLAAAKEVAPGYAELQTDILKQFGPQIQQILAGLQGSTAASNASILAGP